VSKERAKRRAVRLAEGERRRTAAQRRESRRARRRAALRAVVPRLGRTGRLHPRRTRAERAAIVLAALLGLGATWYLIDSLTTRIGLTFLILLALPAFVVLTLDRRAR